MTCFIEQLESSENQDPCPGLELKKGELRLQRNQLPCCNGEGLSFHKSCGNYKRCNLLDRFSKTKKLVSQFYTTWNLSSPFPPIGQQDFVKYRRWLSKLGKDRELKGYALHQRSLSPRPSILWTFALIATWKFNKSVQVVSLGKSYSSDLHNLMNSWQNLNETPIVFLEQPDNGLWKKEYGQALSLVINMCEKSQAPLWLSFNEKPTGETIKTPTRKKFEERIERFAKRPPLQWLQEDSRSRIRYVCRGVEKFL